jgi:hypothetical protein
MNRRIGSLFLVPLASLLFFVIVGATAQGGGTKSATDFGIVIKKKDITSTATFIPYKVNGFDMEIIAVKASDGTIRTALNTCQV